jgi:cytochrome c biogenesis protein CcmG, thiol:disulfide interchange protein DsbE
VCFDSSGACHRRSRESVKEVFPRMKSVKIDWILRGTLVLLSGLLVFVLYSAIHERVVVAGDQAPAFAVTAETGRSVSVPNFGGKLLVLNFWASWCGPCIEETPSLTRFAQNYSGKGVVVLGISVDQNEKAYRAFLQKYSPGFLTARDLKIHEDYGTYMYPETYVIDPNGKVLYKIAQPADWTDPKLTQYIDSLL